MLASDHISRRDFALVPEKYRRCSDRTDAGNKLRRFGKIG